MKRKEPSSEDPIGGASSSSTSQRAGYLGGTKKPKGNDYEVFLSFRGKDTRKGFTDYLYTSLVDAGVHVFRDDNELRIGEKIGLELLCNIMQSKISIPIISENYASSKWCLRELTHMLKCKRSIGQIVLPIFYKVEPSQVRHLIGRFGDAINAHKQNLDEMVVKEWEEALKEVSSLKGWESEKINDGHEGALVKIVVEKVMSELRGRFQLIVPKELVGIDDRVEEIMRFIDAKFNDTIIIGIYGMGGIGKTTLARVLYNNLSSRFQHLSFMANIRETSLRRGIECLQEQLIRDILKKSYDVYNVDEGISVIKSRFVSKQILVLLDDMDDDTHLNALIGDGNWFKAGSIIIITTRNKSILDEARASYMYQLNELPFDQSLTLFSRHAFRKDFPQSDYEAISRDVVCTTAGLPLALEVIGSFLRGKREEVWKDTLKQLNKMPDKEVREKLRISYEALDDEGIEVLRLMSLIKIDKHGNLMMHDQLRDLGREIVRLENPKDPRERSRLWICEEAINVLASNKGTSKIEALCLDNYGRGSYQGEQFKELTNLRFLQVHGANFTGDFQDLLPQLRWLQWKDCPSDFTAANFHPKKLVVLDLSSSGISEDWGGWGPLKMATELKVLNLSNCQSLRRTPELSAFESLEILILRNCDNLEEIDHSIGDIMTLILLDVTSCNRLRKLPTEVGRMKELRELILKFTPIQEIPISRGCLMKLQTLSALFCEELFQLPESLGSLVSLTRLDLSESGIRRLPESMGSLVSLTQLDLSESSIRKLPESVGSLVSLTQLDLSDTKIDELPESMGFLLSLTQLNLSMTRIEQLPRSMGSLMSLTQLDLSDTRLEELPECMGSLVLLTELNLSDTKIKELPESIGSLESLQRLLLSGCCLLREIPSSIGKLASLTELHLKGTIIAELPESIGNLQNLKILDFCETYVTELPGAIGILVKLQELSASHCKNPEGLPSNKGKLVLPNKLDLEGLGISGLPKNISKLSSLQNLNSQYRQQILEPPKLPSGLTTLGITCQSPPLPHLSELNHLKKLTLSNCHWLEHLPELPIGLLMLSITRGKLKVLENLSNLKHLSELILDECFELTEVADLGDLQSLSNLHTRQCPKKSSLDEVQSLGSLRGLHPGERFPDSSKLMSPKVSQPEGSLDLSDSKTMETNVASCMNLVEIQDLGGSKSSQMLDISECSSTGQSLDLSSLTYLRKLVVTKCKNLIEIRGLDGLKSLTDLDISGCTSLRQLPDLSSLKNLQSFYAENCENLVEFQGLDGLESLTHFKISGCTSLRQSLDLSNSKKLDLFYAVNCKNLIDIRGLDGLKSMTDLDISGCTSLRQSLNLSNLTNLDDFQAKNCTSLVEFRGLDGSKNLSHLDISGCTFFKQSLDLSNLTNLRIFEAENCENLIEIQGLDGSKSLRILTISGCTSLKQSLDLSNLTNLEAFDAENCENLVEIRGLDGSESLRSLTISGCTSLRQSLDLSNLTNLEDFDADNCKNLVEIRGLDGSKSLRILTISGCTSLRQSLDLSNLTNLKVFDAENCENLVEIRGLDGSKSLRVLIISGCTSLRQSLDLSNLKNLKIFRAANCENIVEIQGLNGQESSGDSDISGLMSPEQSPDL